MSIGSVALSLAAYISNGMPAANPNIGAGPIQARNSGSGCIAKTKSVLASATRSSGVECGVLPAAIYGDFCILVTRCGLYQDVFSGHFDVDVLGLDARNCYLEAKLIVLFPEHNRGLQFPSNNGDV